MVLCHDGDNAFGGGFTYYNQCVQDLANNVAARGGLMSTVEEYLADFPPDPSRVVHVEDGGWVNADSDFGSPTFINWNYPLLAPNGQVDVVNGWHEKPRDMAIFTASLNRVLTAEQIHGHEVDLGAILYPDASTHPIDRAWHYHLGSLDSGNVYFGPVLDLEIKATIGANEVARLIDPLLADLSNDQTPPTIWLPQRFPYNPGGRNFGVEFGYQEVWDDGDFHIWTFIHDASGPVEATLKYRIDADGVLPLDAVDNHTYAGGPDVGPWISLPMDYREFPKDMPAGYDNGAIDLFVLPEHIAGHYSVEVAGLREVLIDYYVEAVDAHGNIARSPIQHVYVGDGSQAPSGGGGAVALEPDPPVAGMPVAIEYDPTGRVLSGAAEVFLYWGWNNWGTLAPSTVPMAQTPDGTWMTTVSVPADAAQIDMVFNNGAGTWDNNNGQDWKFPTVPFDGGPILSVSPSSLSLTMTAGEPGAQGVLAVSNSGTGTLAYTASVAGSRKPAAEIAEVITGRRAASPDADANQDGVVDAADAVLSERDPGGPAWLSVAGDAQGEVEGGAPASQVAVLVDGEGLAPGAYAGEVLVRAPGALQAPQSIGVVVTVLDGSVPESTTVVPNPPAAGQNATVWYDAAAGPFPGASAINLHWGINGGATGGGAWQGVTTTPMAPGPGSMWFATIALPANAASLNFVTNNGSGVWDNNSGQNWNFAVE